MTRKPLTQAEIDAMLRRNKEWVKSQERPGAALIRGIVLTILIFIGLVIWAIAMRGAQF